MRQRYAGYVLHGIEISSSHLLSLPRKRVIVVLPFTTTTVGLSHLGKEAAGRFEKNIFASNQPASRPHLKQRAEGRGAAGKAEKQKGAQAGFSSCLCAFCADLGMKKKAGAVIHRARPECSENQPRRCERGVSGLQKEKTGRGADTPAPRKRLRL